MGFIKDMKSGTLGVEAKKAARLNMPSSQPGMSGDIDTWGQMIAAIEAEGWTLAHWAVGIDTKGRGEAYPLFRRA